MKLLLWLMVVLVLSVLSSHAQHRNPNPHHAPNYLFHVENKFAGNGIGVGEPKVFDNRSLILMLEQLDASLERLNAIDQAKVLGNVGLLQGFQKSDVARAFTLSTLPMPSVDTTEATGTNAAGLVPHQRVTKFPGFTGSAPELDALSFPSIADERMGLAAQDILTEQVHLTYQILNLRMLLERSISDRYIKVGRNEGPRTQAVLGFQVSLDPMKQHKGKAAIVEIELKPPRRRNRPSLVSLMPQAKTYNVASISQKSTSFSGSAVVKVVSLGYSQRHSGQTYFIHQDSDTIAFERPREAAPPDTLLFGWQFRPVLNLPSVEGGIRQLFAVIALDELSGADARIDVTVRTYWASYDKKAAVISSRPTDTNTFSLERFSIPSTRAIQNGLGPRVDSVTFKASRDDAALIDVRGENFYNGTSAIIGQSVLTRSSPELIIKSDQLLQIAVRPADLIFSQPYLGGRYGPSVELVDYAGLDSRASRPDPFIVVATSENAISPKSELLVTLLKQNGRTPDLKGRDVIYAVGTNVFVRQPQKWPGEEGLQALLELPAGTVEKHPVVSVTVPFLGPEYHRSYRIYYPQAVERAVLLRSDNLTQEWGIVGKGFDASIIQDQSTEVFADKAYRVGNGLEFVSQTLAKFRVPTDKIPTIKSIVVSLGGNVPVLLEPPKLPSPKLALNKAVVPSATVGSAPSIEFEGTNLTEIAKISFDGSALVFASPSAGKVGVFLSRKVTEKPGRASLIVEAKDGSLHAADITVNP